MIQILSKLNYLYLFNGAKPHAAGSLLPSVSTQCHQFKKIRTAAKKLGGAYYILPSSMHEVLLLAKDKDTDPSQLKEIVEEVNLTDAVSTDFLSNHVYEYDSDEDTVTIVV